MRGDFSRYTFDPKKRYSGVWMQQGRVQLDSDWNEQQAINRHRIEAECRDVVGRSGAPATDPGFEITVDNDGDLCIGKGRYYVDGILCENNDERKDTDHIKYQDQPDLPDAPDIIAMLSGADYGVVYLDAWHRDVTAIDDPQIKETALGGADTATRSKVVWQVKVLPLKTMPDQSDCDAQLFKDNKITLNARAKQPDNGSSEPCIVKTNAGYRRLENQLYRIEIHKSGKLREATFKWSQDNGSVDIPIDEINGREAIIQNVGQGLLENFKDGTWVELVDDNSELNSQGSQPRDIITVVRGPDASRNVITLEEGFSWNGGNGDLKHAKLRKWVSKDMLAEVPETNDGWIPLGDEGIEVKFGIESQEDEFQSGDYWLIPARVATGDIEWPIVQGTKDPMPQPPMGIKHHYCRLAGIKKTAISETSVILERTNDCRKIFPPLTGICASDVSYDDSGCRIGQMENVQEALDRLCAEKDLRHHNKFLHGWGIVCGLQVVCGRVRNEVVVKEGYAIDPRGNDILLEEDMSLDLLKMGEDGSPILEAGGNGDLCLSLELDENSAKRFKLEKYDPSKDDWEQRLKGTLLMNLYLSHFKRFHDFIKDELWDDNAKRPLKEVSQRDKNLAVITNLLARPINRYEGPVPFISPQEHEAIEKLYNKAVDIMKEETFCAGFSKAFPKYSLKKIGLNTIFGTGHHSRLKIKSDGSEAFTVGEGLDPTSPTSLINRYDLKKGALVEQIDPLAREGILPIRRLGSGPALDVALSPDGKRIFAIVASGRLSTFFCAGDLGLDGQIKWMPAAIIEGIRLQSLATTGADPKKVYAVGRRGTQEAGLYQIDPDNVKVESPAVKFNPFGHLKITASGKAFATFLRPKLETPTSGTPTSGIENMAQPDGYDGIKCIQIPGLALLGDINLQMKGRDDIAISLDEKKVYSVVGPVEGKKYVLAHDMPSGPASEIKPTVIMPGMVIREYGNLIFDYDKLGTSVSDFKGQVFIPQDREGRIGGGVFQPENVTMEAGNTLFLARHEDGTVATASSLEAKATEEAKPFIHAANGLSKIRVPNKIKFVPWDIAAPPITFDNTNIRLEPWGDSILVGLEDGYCLKMVEASSGRLIDGYSLPLEAGPIAISSSKKTKRIYVLNSISSTLCDIPEDILRPDFRFEFGDLDAYHHNVSNALSSLLVGFIQYLKDSLHDQMIVDCPDIGNEKIFLACISVRNNQVHKVCNFSKRRYVKTASPADHWCSPASLLPLLGWMLQRVPPSWGLSGVLNGTVIPLLNWLIDKGGCFVLGDLMDKFWPYIESGLENANLDLRADGFRHGVASAYLEKEDLLLRLRNLINRGRVRGRIFVDPLQRKELYPMLDVEPQISSDKIVDQPSDIIEETLGAKGIHVLHKQYDPSIGLIPGRINMKGFLGIPRPGDEVTLYEEDGRIKYYTVVSRDAPAEVQSLSQIVQEQQTVIQNLKKTLEDYDKRIVEAEKLSNRASEFDDRIKAVEGLSIKVNDNTNKIKDLEGLGAKVNDNTAKISGLEDQADKILILDKRIKDLEGLNIKVSDNNVKIKELEDKTSKFSAYDDRIKKVEDLGVKVNDNATKIKGLEALDAKVNDNSAKIKGLEDQTGKLPNYEARIKELEGMKKTVDGYENRIKAVETTSVENNKKIGEINTKVTDIQGRIIR